MAPIDLAERTFTCVSCKQRYSTQFRSKTLWVTDQQKDLDSDDICMKCKAPPPNDGGGRPGTPVLRAA